MDYIGTERENSGNHYNSPQIKYMKDMKASKTGRYKGTDHYRISGRDNPYDLAKPFRLARLNFNHSQGS